MTAQRRGMAENGTVVDADGLRHVAPLGSSKRQRLGALLHKSRRELAELNASNAYLASLYAAAAAARDETEEAGTEREVGLDTLPSSADLIRGRGEPQVAGCFSVRGRPYVPLGGEVAPVPAPRVLEAALSKRRRRKERGRKGQHEGGAEDGRTERRATQANQQLAEGEPAEHLHLQQHQAQQQQQQQAPQQARQQAAAAAATAAAAAATLAAQLGKRSKNVVDFAAVLDELTRDVALAEAAERGVADARASGTARAAKEAAAGRVLPAGGFGFPHRDLADSEARRCVLRRGARFTRSFLESADPVDAVIIPIVLALEDVAAAGPALPAARSPGAGSQAAVPATAASASFPSSPPPSTGAARPADGVELPAPAAVASEAELRVVRGEKEDDDYDDEDDEPEEPRKRTHNSKSAINIAARFVIAHKRTDYVDQLSMRLQEMERRLALEHSAHAASTSRATDEAQATGLAKMHLRGLVAGPRAHRVTIHASTKAPASGEDKDVEKTRRATVDDADANAAPGPVATASGATTAAASGDAAAEARAEDSGCSAAARGARRALTERRAKFESARNALRDQLEQQLARRRVNRVQVLRNDSRFTEFASRACMTARARCDGTFKAQHAREVIQLVQTLARDKAMAEHLSASTAVVLRRKPHPPPNGVPVHVAERRKAIAHRRSIAVGTRQRITSERLESPETAQDRQQQEPQQQPPQQQRSARSETRLVPAAPEARQAGRSQSARRVTTAKVASRSPRRATVAACDDVWHLAARAGPEPGTPPTPDSADGENLPASPSRQYAFHLDEGTVFESALLFSIRLAAGQSSVRTPGAAGRRSAQRAQRAQRQGRQQPPPAFALSPALLGLLRVLQVRLGRDRELRERKLRRILQGLTEDVASCRQCDALLAHLKALSAREPAQMTAAGALSGVLRGSPHAHP